MITDNYVLEPSGMSEEEIWFIPLTPTGESHPDALTARMSYRVEFPKNLCCACGEPEPTIVEEIEFLEESALSSLPLLFPYKKEAQLIVGIPICKKCAENIEGKDKWAEPWEKLGTWSRIQARRKLSKLVQFSILPQHPNWLRVTLANKEYSDTFKAAYPNAQRKL